MRTARSKIRGALRSRSAAKSIWRGVRAQSGCLTRDPGVRQRGASLAGPSVTPSIEDELSQYDRVQPKVDDTAPPTSAYCP
ncbi:unnamed protein product, partial [Iphiclides podalirius]